MKSKIIGDFSLQPKKHTHTQNNNQFQIISPLIGFLGSNVKNLSFITTKLFYLLVMSWFKSWKFQSPRLSCATWDFAICYAADVFHYQLPPTLVKHSWFPRSLSCSLSPSTVTSNWVIECHPPPHMKTKQWPQPKWMKLDSFKTHTHTLLCLLSQPITIDDFSCPSSSNHNFHL